LPTAAIQRGAPGAYVYVINADNTVSVRQVSTGPVDGNITAINSGLSAGERVVIDGTDRLRDGLKVTVAGENGPAAGPAAASGAASGKDQSSGQHSGRSHQPPPAGR